MQLLSKSELEVVEKNSNIFTEGCDLREVYKACSSYCYTGNILLATAYVSKYPFKLRFYPVDTLNASGQIGQRLRVDLTAQTPYGEYLLMTGSPHPSSYNLDNPDTWPIAAKEFMYTEYPVIPNKDLDVILRDAIGLHEKGKYLKKEYL